MGWSGVALNWPFPYPRITSVRPISLSYTTPVRPGQLEPPRWEAAALPVLTATGGAQAGPPQRFPTAVQPHPLFKFRNNAQLAAQLPASISHVALIGPN